MSKDTPSRPSAVTHRLTLAFLLGVALLGGWLLVRSLVGRDGGGLSSASGPPEPEWLSRAPLKSDFTALIAPPEEGKDNDLADIVAAEEKLYSDGFLAQSVWQTTRTLPRGHEFDSGLSLVAESSSDEAMEFELRVTRAGAEVVTYHAELGENGLRRLQYGPPDAELQDVAVKDETPLAIGDLRVHDAVDFYTAFKAGRVRPLGTLSTFNSVELKVFEVELSASRPDAEGDGDAAPQGSAREYAALAADALLYCDGTDLTPRTIRFFDDGGRLVRTYTDFVFDRAGPDTADSGKLRVTHFRVDSVSTTSSTFFRLESATLEAQQD